MATLSQERKLLDPSNKSSLPGTLFSFLKIEGPGWMLSAAAIGTGVLAGSIGLGMFLGLEAIWIQVLSMILGVFVLSAISHICLGSQQTLFNLIKNEWNPTLAWWLAGSALLTNFAWCMPQFRIGAEISGQFLIPALSGKGGQVLIALFMLISAVAFSFLYEKSGMRASFIQWTVKGLVLVISILCIASLVILLPHSTFSLSELFAGFLPSSQVLSETSPIYATLIQASGGANDFWNEQILEKQRSLVLTSFSSALGVNLIFAFPLLILGRGWERGHRKFASFNLWTTCFVPFFIFSFTMVVLSSLAFYGDTHGKLEETTDPEVHQILENRLVYEIGEHEFAKLAPFQVEEKINQLPPSEMKLANLLLGHSVDQLIDKLISIANNSDSVKFILALLVLLTAFSTIVVLMVVSGHLLCEVLGRPHKGALFQSGSLLLALSSVGPFIWAEQGKWVSDPTYFISLAMMPFALISIFLILNNKELLGRERPSGFSGYLLVVGSALSVLLLGSSSLYIAWNHTLFDLPAGKLLVVLIAALLIIGHFSLKNKKLANKISGLETKLNHLQNK